MLPRPGVDTDVVRSGLLVPDFGQLPPLWVKGGTSLKDNQLQLDGGIQSVDPATFWEGRDPFGQFRLPGHSGPSNVASNDHALVCGADQGVDGGLLRWGRRRIPPPVVLLPAPWRTACRNALGNWLST
ncbi:hypothetical protein R1flu_017261 [Riccia fluitans]|uniref:Uncharacterized protein n=1 Tax=Riccia fluitans TaxID=41844 RepID=A0ABD1XEL7_9MARC